MIEFTIASWIDLDKTWIGIPDDFFPISLCYNPCAEITNKLVSRKVFFYEKSFKSGVGYWLIDFLCWTNLLAIFHAKIPQLLYLIFLGRISFYKEVFHERGGQQRRRGRFRSSFIFFDGEQTNYEHYRGCIGQYKKNLLGTLLYSILCENGLLIKL